MDHFTFTLKLMNFTSPNQRQVYFIATFLAGKNNTLYPVAMLGLLIPEAELFLRNKVSKMVALAAALDATLVGGASSCRVSAPAVLQ